MLAIGIYAGTAQIAVGFSEPNDNMLHMFGIVSWLTSQFDGFVLTGFFLRALTPLLIPVAFLVGIARRWNHESDSGAVRMLLFASLCIWAQPLLAGPDVTGGNAPRLVTIGLPPLCLVLAIKLRDAGVFADMSGSRRLPWVMALLALGSMHHWYVSARIPSFGQQLFFAAAYALAAIGSGLVTYLEAVDLGRHTRSQPLRRPGRVADADPVASEDRRVWLWMAS